MDRLHYLLMKSHAVLSRRALSEASKAGLTAGQPKILEFLWDHGESDQKTIAAHCEIEQTTVGSILLRMEQAGLIVRRQHEGNRRSLFVSLTQSGEQAARRVEEIFEQVEAPVVAALSEEELRTLKELLKKTCRAMADSGADRRDQA